MSKHHPCRQEKQPEGLEERWNAQSSVDLWGDDGENIQGSKHIRNKEVISQYRPTKGEMMSDKPDSHNQMNSLVKKRRAVNLPFFLIMSKPMTKFFHKQTD